MFAANRLFLTILLVAACYPAIAEAASVTLSRVDKIPPDSSVQKRRISGWQQFVLHNHHVSLMHKLKLVNAYLNQFDYQNDNTVFDGKDAWATPYEFLMHNGGDCEDFAIAKYFLLRSLGVDEERLQITYVYHHKRKQFHMVLIYLPLEQGQVLVLDNLTNSILPLAVRHDIEPVYGFNQHHMWVLGKTAQRTQVGGAERLSHWQALLGRMREQPLGSISLLSG